MEHPVKEGILYIQHPKFGKKTWRKVWGQLFADSPSGIARLEYFEARDNAKGEKGTLRKGERKVIRLSDCVSVERAGEHSSPKDTAPFCLCLMERNCFLAADQPDDWIERICQLAFQRPSAQSSTAGNTPSPQPQMEENAIYSSWQETCEYPVTVVPTEASTKCHLKGNYLMASLPEQLVLKDVQSGQALYTWPYAFLRRFGLEKNMFSFEAGRRCNSGEGLFTFNTVRAAEIYRSVLTTINRQKSLLERDKKAGISSSQESTQKSGAWSWPSSREGLEEVSPLYTRNPAEPMERANSHSVSAETRVSEKPIIYASIGRSFPVLFQACAKTEAELKEQGEQLSDHLYENLCALEQGVVFHPLESASFSYRDSPEGSSSSSSQEPSPIYDNSPLIAKRSASHPSPSPRMEGPDSSPERQCLPPQSLDCQEAASGGEGNAKSKSGGAGAFKNKLVTMLSRDGGAPKAASRSVSPMDKS
ncbi:docking protein 3 isoform X2 [Pogona vitticeps]